MQTVRTETGFQLENMQVDTKPYGFLPTQQARTLLLVAKGLPQKQIASELGVKVPTVKKQCNDLSYKFKTHSMRETVHAAIQQGVLRYVFTVILCVAAGFNDEVERSYRSARQARRESIVRLV